jgi:6-hydroxytryprostatin B O-methyltransferase
MLELVQAISINASILDGHLTAHNLPQPSFAADGPTSVLPPTAPKAARDASLALADAAFRLFRLVTGPSGVLPNITAGFHTAHALEWLLHFDVLPHVPLSSGSAITYDALAVAAGVPEPQLRSVARMAMTSAILAEPRPGVVAHTAASAMFVRQPLMRDWARYMFAASMPTAAAMVRQTERWPGSLKKNETAYNIAFGHDLPFFEHLSQDPALTKQFSGYMKSVTDGQGMSLDHLLAGFDWAGLPEGALVVDVRRAFAVSRISIESLTGPFHPRLEGQTGTRVTRSLRRTRTCGLKCKISGLLWTVPNLKPAKAIPRRSSLVSVSKHITFFSPNQHAARRFICCG